MAFRFNVEGSLPEQFARIVKSEAKASLKALATEDSAKQPEAVHTARKSVKKLRACLRLVSNNLAPKVFRQENRHLRETGHLLAELRDAEALLQTFDQTGNTHGWHEDELAVLRTELRKQSDDILTPTRVTETLIAARAAMQEVVARLTEPGLPDGGLELVEKGLQNSYQKGRKAMQRAQAKGGTEAMHNWRKRVKDHWYHARLLAGVDPAFWEPRATQLKTLEGLLGDAHNAAVLKDRLTAVKGRDSRRFRRELHAMRRKLETEALTLGKSLYADKHLHWQLRPEPIAA